MSGPGTYNENGHPDIRGGRDRGTASFLGGHACRLSPDEACRLLQPAGALSRSGSPLPLLVGATAGAPASGIAAAPLHTAVIAGPQATKNPESVTLSGFVRAGPWDSGGAEERNRTPDLLITNELLYRLSYFGNMFRRSGTARNSSSVFRPCEALCVADAIRRRHEKRGAARPVSGKSGRDQALACASWW
ncbi:hypothetical protein CBM2586_A11204 [Cupriavidus phytorum]|uniref:Uncharacterized protein n=1 Tax=Cupriavidus taiwanensis TaxID=164546 RepID=A0A975ZWT8_9BURK|nr:hypothetical protein CBM2586_A11204 [Cupriavidus taiwanensis]